MKVRHITWPRLGAFAAGLLLAAVPRLVNPAQAQAPAAKPNIMFIMGDDIGWMQPSIYHRGLMVGETPNIDRIGSEGAIFMDYLAMQSCTSGRNAFFTGMYPLRTGMIPPQLPKEDRQTVLRLVQSGTHARHHSAARQVSGHDGHKGWQGLGHPGSRHEAAGRQHRLCPEEARGHRPAGQHDRRLHYRQWRRDGYLPRWRDHAVQGPEGRGLGRRLPVAASRPLARAYQAGNGQEPDVRGPRLVAHVG